MRTRPLYAIALLLTVSCAGAGAPADPTTTTSTAPTTTAPTSTTSTAPTTTSTAAAACSASGLEAEAPDQEGLPEAAAETRRQIVETAAACDYEGLVELAGPDFTYSFGDGADPAGFWRNLEERGEEPLRFMVELLRRPYGTIETEGETLYVWPSAFAYDIWSEVPEEDRRALEPLYDQEDFEDFELFGGYVGYRIGIAEDGTWLFFVAGD